MNHQDLEAFLTCRKIQEKVRANPKLTLTVLSGPYCTLTVLSGGLNLTLFNISFVIHFPVKGKKKTTRTSHAVR